MQRDPAALKSALADLEQQSLKRRRRMGVAPGVVNFCSNDYLGLKDHPDVVRAFTEAAAKYGVGSGSAELVTGHGPEHQALEEELAAFTGRERALVFSTGYMANMGVIGALADQKSVIVSDKLNHASLIDGCRLSDAGLKRFRHGDATHAAELLTAIEAAVETRLLVTDGVFSMDGDLAPLPALAESARAAKAWLMVDDAHGLGVIGRSGRGSCEHFGLAANDVPILIGTFGKALGTFGAFVAGDADLIEYLVQKARSYIYTTALPPAVAAATRASLRVSEREGWRREKALGLARHFCASLRALGIEAPSESTIVPVIVGDPGRALAVSQSLEQRGFLVTAIRPPTVPAGTARLRITFSATQEVAQVDALVSALAQALRA